MSEIQENSSCAETGRKVVAFHGDPLSAGKTGDLPMYRVKFEAPGSQVGLPVPSGFIVSEAEEPHFRITQVSAKTGTSIPISQFISACKEAGWLLSCEKDITIAAENSGEAVSGENLYTLSHKTCKMDGFYAVPGGCIVCRSCLHRLKDSVCDVAGEVEIEYFADGMIYCVEKTNSKPDTTKSKPEIETAETKSKPEILI